MKKLNYTPGPWIMSSPYKSYNGGIYPEDAKRRIEAAHTLDITVSPCGDGFVSGQNEGNARLIAAAPEMYELLIKLYRSLPIEAGRTMIAEVMDKI